MKLRAALLSGFLATAPVQALACAFHGYTPEPTLVDVLLGSQDVVLARPDPNNARRLVVVDTLLGASETGELGVIVDTKLRARLLADTRQTLLFARDGAYGPWLQLAALDEPYRKVIDTVMRHHSTWQVGGDQERYQTFARLLRDQNANVRRLALLELDRADYTILSKLRLPNAAIQPDLIDGGDADLRPIRILLAGLSGDRDLLQPLAGGLNRAIETSVPYLGAYATALIELGGPDAVDHILTTHFDSSAASDTREKLLEALAIQSQVGAAKTRRAVRQGVADLLSRYPELAPAVARQFGFRGDWSMGDALKQAVSVRRPNSIEDLFAVNQYIGLASRNPRP